MVSGGGQEEDRLRKEEGRYGVGRSLALKCQMTFKKVVTALNRRSRAGVTSKKVSPMMDGKQESAAKTGSHPPEGKRSYTQAVTSSQHQPFFRRIDYSIGFVEKIHRTSTNAYARITVGKGEELSIKVPTNTSLYPGDYVKVTTTKADHTTNASIYGIHYGQVPELVQRCSM